MTVTDAPSGTTRLLAGFDRPDAATLAGHLDLFGPPPPSGHTAATLSTLLEQAGLTGRGGAGFPTGAKLAALAGRRRPTVVVNAMEGEPASHKDEVLATGVPHLVLDGAELVARALRASALRICVARDRPGSARAFEQAVAERRAAGLLAVDDVEVCTPPARYVAGEESALVHWLDGGESLPTFRPTRPGTLRVAGRPTLVDNAETMATIGLIGRFGPDWFRAVGSPDAPGTRLVTVSGDVAAPGVFEVPGGLPLRSLLTNAGSAEDLAGVLLGGYGGSWLAGGNLDVALSPGALFAEGCTLGPGIVVALGRPGCGLAETARIARWMAGESAGQCGPCAFGLPAVADDLEALAFGRSSARAADRLWGRLAAVEGRGACRHPDGVVRLVRSAFAAFAADVDHHVRQGPCPAARRDTVMALPQHVDEGVWR